MKTKKIILTGITVILITLSFFSFNDIQSQRFEYMTVAYRPFNGIALFTKGKPSGGQIHLYKPDGTTSVIQMENNDLIERTTLLKELNSLGSEGWEIIDMQHIKIDNETYTGSLEREYLTIHTEYILKRAIK